MKRILIFIIVLVGMLTIGCSQKSPKITDGRGVYHKTEENTSKEDTEDGNSEEEMETDKTVIIKKIDYDNNTITVQNISDGESYELAYTGGCDIRNKYDEIISITQIDVGQIVKITYDSKKNKMEALHEASEPFVYENIKDFTINIQDNRITVAGEDFIYNKNLAVFSDGQEISVTDISNEDELTVAGIDTTVYSITVSKGHGYLTLENETYFNGGWIEIGNDYVEILHEGEEYCVSEGTYDVLVSKNGYGGSKSVTIGRNEHVSLDVSNLIGEEVKQGSVQFEITPDTAILWIDNQQTDYKELITLTYGIHSVCVKASGYETVNSLLKVGQNLATIPITLTSSSGETKSEATEETTEDTEKDTTASNTKSKSLVNSTGANLTDSSNSTNTSDSSSSESSTELLNDVLNQLLNK